MSQPTVQRRPASRARVVAAFVSVAAASAAGLPARAAEVRGTIAMPSELPEAQGLGFTRARVTAPSAAYRALRREAVVFFEAKDTLPLPTPSARWKLRISGQKFEPRVLACAVDEQIELVNEDPRPLTVRVGNEKLEPLKAGASLTYLCQQPGPKPIRIAEYPHAGAELFVGEVGLVAPLAADGRFSVQAPPGTYTLVVYDLGGRAHEAPVTVQQAPLDLGRIEPHAGRGAKAEPVKAEPAKGAAPAPTPSPSASPSAPPPPSAPPASAAPAPARPPPPPAASATPRPRPRPSPSSGDSLDLEP
jgi:hypothetical protein